MRAFIKIIGDVVRDRRAATAVEYGFILALIVLAMMASLMQVANVTIGMWNNVNGDVQSATH